MGQYKRNCSLKGIAENLTIFIAEKDFETIIVMKAVSMFKLISYTHVNAVGNNVKLM